MVSGAWLNKRFFAGQKWGKVTWAKIGRWSADCIISDGLSGWNLRRGCPFPVRCLGRRHWPPQIFISWWYILMHGLCCSGSYKKLKAGAVPSIFSLLQTTPQQSASSAARRQRLQRRHKTACHETAHPYLLTHPFPSMCPALVAKKAWRKLL